MEIKIIKGNKEFIVTTDKEHIVTEDVKAMLRIVCSFLNVEIPEEIL